MTYRVSHSHTMMYPVTCSSHGRQRETNSSGLTVPPASTAEKSEEENLQICQTVLASFVFNKLIAVATFQAEGLIPLSLVQKFNPPRLTGLNSLVSGVLKWQTAATVLTNGLIHSSCTQPINSWLIITQSAMNKASALSFWGRDFYWAHDIS
jgi:hypothetical protein